MNLIDAVSTFMYIAEALLVGTETTFDGLYHIGVGKTDVTGPAADVNMMGYASPTQNTAGIHMRQFSRAFIIKNHEFSVVFVSVDCAMASQMVTMEVIRRLKEKYGDLYTEKNVCISGTHTHSAPGGFLQYWMYVFSSLGYKESTFNALIEGIFSSIEKAHRSLQPGYIYYNTGELHSANINRSPTSYLLNPKAERERYKHNVDKEMFLLKFTDVRNRPVGMINWFAVHCTSMNSSNHLISGDNKGYASQLFEKAMDNSMKRKFVAAFAQANEGDVSPNINGEICIDSGLSCDARTSSCNKRSTYCVASGPGKDMFESTKIIGQRQFHKAKELFDNADKRLSGPISFIVEFIDMANQTFEVGGKKVKTCLPAMGYSFAAGTTDGPGVGIFIQGTKTRHRILERISGLLLNEPSEDQEKCHKPKPILLNTGETKYPYQWQPTIVTTQLLKLGNLVIAPVPGEFTTMSGRRLKTAIEEAMRTAADKENKIKVVIAGLSNAYSSYVTTYEEYQAQRYEAASTVYGPYTLDAYLKIYTELAEKLAKNTSVESGDKLPNMTKESKLYSKSSNVDFDIKPNNMAFGAVLQDVSPSYEAGDTVRVKFVAGNPRNDLMINRSYLIVAMIDKDTDDWKIVATDDDWETKFIYVSDRFYNCGTATIEWDTTGLNSTQRYRISHYGRYRLKQADGGDITIKYSGHSSEFNVYV